MVFMWDMIVQVAVDEDDLLIKNIISLKPLGRTERSGHTDIASEGQLP